MYDISAAFYSVARTKPPDKWHKTE